MYRKLINFIALFFLLFSIGITSFAAEGNKLLRDFQNIRSTITGIYASENELKGTWAYQTLVTTEIVCGSVSKYPTHGFWGVLYDATYNLTAHNVPGLLCRVAGPFLPESLQTPFREAVNVAFPILHAYDCYQRPLPHVLGYAFGFAGLFFVHHVFDYFALNEKYLKESRGFAYYCFRKAGWFTADNFDKDINFFLHQFSQVVKKLDPFPLNFFVGASDASYDNSVARSDECTQPATEDLCKSSICDPNDAPMSNHLSAEDIQAEYMYYCNLVEKGYSEARSKNIIPLFLIGENHESSFSEHVIRMILIAQSKISSNSNVVLWEADYSTLEAFIYFNYLKHHNIISRETDKSLRTQRILSAIDISLYPERCKENYIAIHDKINKPEHFIEVLNCINNSGRIFPIDLARQTDTSFQFFKKSIEAPSACENNKLRTSPAPNLKREWGNNNPLLGFKWEYTKAGIQFRDEVMSTETTYLAKTGKLERGAATIVGAKHMPGLFKKLPKEYFHITPILAFSDEELREDIEKHIIRKEYAEELLKQKEGIDEILSSRPFNDEEISMLENKIKEIDQHIANCNDIKEYNDIFINFVKAYLPEKAIIYEVH